MTWLLLAAGFEHVAEKRRMGLIGNTEEKQTPRIILGVCGLKAGGS
jgi:hypothetical protein